MAGITINTSADHPTTALLLGSGELGKEIAIELMRYGIRVIACDRYENAPAMLVASEHAVLNMKDPKALTALIRQVKPDFVIPEIEAIATDVLLKLEQEEGLKVVPSGKAVRTTMDREAIRTLAAVDLDLPTSPYFFASSAQEVLEQIDTVGFPCIMKPVMSSSGKGQSVLKDEDDVKKAFELAVAEGRGHEERVIIEGMVRFDREITLLTVSAADGIFFCQPIGHRQENGDYRESWQPQELSDETLVECKRIASKVVKALGGYGLFGVELFICGNHVLFSELSPRPHDTGMVTMISQDQSEFALHVRALLGLPVGSITQLGPAASAAIVVEGKGNNLTYGNLNDVLSCGKRTALRIFGKPEVDGERRMAVALAMGSNIEEAQKTAISMRDLLEVSVEDNATAPKEDETPAKKSDAKAQDKKRGEQA